MSEYISRAYAGYVVEELSAMSISEAIQQAALDKSYNLLEQKGRSARNMIKESFLWPKIAKMMDEKVYSKIAKSQEQNARKY